MATHPLSRASPSTARKVGCLFTLILLQLNINASLYPFVAPGGANSSTLLDGIETVRSGQCVIPVKPGVGPGGGPHGRNLFEPGGLGIHSARPGPRTNAAELSPVHRERYALCVIALACFVGST